MIAVIQRVKSAAVAVDGKTVGECGEGLYVLLGVSCGDTERDADALADHILDGADRRLGQRIEGERRHAETAGEDLDRHAG